MDDAELEILLIEDNMNDADLAMRTLRKNHATCKIVHLRNGAEAINFIFGKREYEGRNVLHLPKVILLDLKIPKLSGLEVLKKIKSDELTKKVPVAVLTSSKENLDVESAYAFGANCYIVKPVEFDEFRKVITQLGLFWLHVNHPPA